MIFLVSLSYGVPLCREVNLFWKTKSSFEIFKHLNMFEGNRIFNKTGVENTVNGYFVNFG